MTAPLTPKQENILYLLSQPKEFAIEMRNNPPGRGTWWLNRADLYCGEEIAVLLRLELATQYSDECEITAEGREYLSKLQATQGTLL